MTAASAHPWLGALFGDRDTAALFSGEAVLDRMLRVEAAWTRCIAPADDGDRIAALIETVPIAPADLASGTARDGVPVPALVSRLKQAIPPGDHRWVHTGLTSQDVIDTSLMLTLQSLFPLLAARLDTLTTALDRLVQLHGTSPLMAMTRMQPALPITAAERIGNWQRPLTTLSQQIPPLADRAAILQWGGPVGRRDPELPADTGPRFATALGLRDPGQAWHSDRTVLAEVAGFLSRLTGATGKIGQDIAMMAQMGTITLSGGGTSSAMPHKQNPILAELLVTLARRNAGDLALMHTALVHEQERSGAAWMLEWLTLPQMAETAARSLTAARDLVASVTRIGSPPPEAGTPT